MEGETGTPLRTEEEAQEYFIQCMIAVPTCVWEAFDGLRIQNILKFLATGTRRYCRSRHVITVRMNRFVRKHKMPAQDEYLAFQLHMGQVDVPRYHLTAIARHHWESLLTWDPSIEPPVFDVNDTESTVDRDEWYSWRDKQRKLICPTQEAIQAMSAPARHFRESTMNGLRVIAVNLGGIRWTVDNVPLGMGPGLIQAHFANGIPAGCTPPNTSSDLGQGSSSNHYVEMEDSGSPNAPEPSNNEPALPAPLSEGSAANGEDMAGQNQEPAPLQPNDTTAEVTQQEEAPEEEARSPSLQPQSTPPQQSMQVSTEPRAGTASDLVKAMARLTDALEKHGGIMEVDQQKDRDAQKGAEEGMRALGSDLAAGIRKTIKKTFRKEMKRMVRKQSGVRKTRRE